MHLDSGSEKVRFWPPQGCLRSVRDRQRPGCLGFLVKKSSDTKIKVVRRRPAVRGRGGGGGVGRVMGRVLGRHPAQDGEAARGRHRDDAVPADRAVLHPRTCGNKTQHTRQHLRQPIIHTHTEPGSSGHSTWQQRLWLFPCHRAGGPATRRHARTHQQQSAATPSDWKRREERPVSAKHAQQVQHQQQQEEEEEEAGEGEAGSRGSPPPNSLGTLRPGTAYLDAHLPAHRTAPPPPPPLWPALPRVRGLGGRVALGVTPPPLRDAALGLHGRRLRRAAATRSSRAERGGSRGGGVATAARGGAARGGLLRG
eukprot:SAG25_NODE_354_length_9250_cov_2.824281_5_plen_311_part_00